MPCVSQTQSQSQIHCYSFFSDTTLHRKSLFLHCINPYNFHTGAGRGVRGPAAYWRIFVQNRPIFGRLIVRRVFVFVTLDWVDRFSTEIEKKLVSICIYTFSFTHFCCSVVWGFEFLLELRSCKAIVFQLGHWLTLVPKELYLWALSTPAHKNVLIHPKSTCS